jgi:hypothetical protein
MALVEENNENAKSTEIKKRGEHPKRLNQPPVTNPVNQRQSAAEPVSTATSQPQLAAEPVSTATSQPQLAAEPVSTATSQQQLAAEPVSTATSQPQLGSAVAVVGNTAQGHTVPVPADTTTTGQTLLAQHQQTVDDLPLTHISPAIDNSPEDEPHTEEGTFSNAYSFILRYKVILYDSLM